MEFFDGLREWLDKLQHEDVTNLPISPPLLYTAKEGCLQNTARVRDFVGEWIQFGHDFAFWIGIPCNQSDLFFTSSNITGDIPRWFDDKSLKPHGYMRLQRASLYMRSSSRSLSGGIERISKSKSWMSLGRKNCSFRGWSIDPFPETNSKFAPENGWLEDEIPVGSWPIFWCELLVSGRVFVVYPCEVHHWWNIFPGDQEVCRSQIALSA